MGKHLEYINNEWRVVDDTTGYASGMHITPPKEKKKKDIYENEEEEYPFCSRLYVNNFVLNTENRKTYPYNVIKKLNLRIIDFAPVTIFYGGNGSGKSTILNIIATKLGIRNKTEGNTNAYFKGYLDDCGFEMFSDSILPDDSEYIRSEDVMDGIMKNRRHYATMKRMAMASEKSMPVVNGKEGEMLNNYMNNADALSASDRFFLSRCTTAGTAVAADNISDTFMSNGETALLHYRNSIRPDNLYFLDEPETSLSPTRQQELAQMIETYSKGLRTQFIIATHSPFFLAIEGARIYDLDSQPVRIRQWQELDSMQAYFKLFNDNKDKFNQ